MDENEIGRHVVKAAIKVHQETGPGLLESVYESLLQHELQHRGLVAKRQVPVPVTYCGQRFELGFTADLVVENLVIIELKSVQQLQAAHKKQILTYLKLTDMRLGFLLNFGEAVMKTGIVRLVNGLAEANDATHT